MSERDTDNADNNFFVLIIIFDNIFFLGGGRRMSERDADNTTRQLGSWDGCV